MELRPAKETEYESLLDLLELCFDERDLFARYIDFDPAFRWGDLAVAECDDRLVGCVQLFRKQLRLAGELVPVGGIGSVATHPEYRGRGIARELLTERERYLRDLKIPLALLFTDIPEFYTRLGWIALPLRQFRIRFPGAGPIQVFQIRRFAGEDLESVRALFDAYASRFEGAIARDAAYWEGQLRYAGTPDEQFHVLETRGQIAAYSRSVQLDFGTVVMEHAYLPGAAEGLCGLFASQLGESSALLRLPQDEELEVALRRATRTFERIDDPSPMWRVISRERVRELLGTADAFVSDASLLQELIHDRGVHLWASDRF